MKKHRERIWILAGLILVGILFLLSSTDLILKEEQREIYTVAVILPEDGDALANYRRGIDQAASMENVDIYYETVYKTKAGYDYEAAALQTAEDNPEAVILLGADGGREGWLDRAGRNIPVVSLGGVQAYGQNSCRITADYRNQGELLAQSILEDSQPGERVIIYSRKWNEEGVLECAEGLESVLKIQGRETLRVADPGMVQGHERSAAAGGRRRAAALRGRLYQRGCGRHDRGAYSGPGSGQRVRYGVSGGKERGADDRREGPAPGAEAGEHSGAAPGRVRPV